MRASGKTALALALGACAACVGCAASPRATAEPREAAPPARVISAQSAAANRVPDGVPIAATQAFGSGALRFSGPLTQGGWIRGNAGSGTKALMLDGKPVALAPDGEFLIAFDRDAGPAATLVATRRDGTSERRTLTIAPRAWQIESIDAPFRPPGTSSAEFQRIRAGELAQIAAARARPSDAQGWRQAFVWPARGRVSGRFGSQRIYRGTPGSYHSGLDIAAPTGTPFVAPADGVVILAARSPFTLEGHLLMIDHGAGLNSAFLHCAELLVGEGESVRQGQTIGRIGATGRATGPHLHWSLKWRDIRPDPILFVEAGPGRAG